MSKFWKGYTLVCLGLITISCIDIGRAMLIETKLEYFMKSRETAEKAEINKKRGLDLINTNAKLVVSLNEKFAKINQEINNLNKQSSDIQKVLSNCENKGKKNGRFKLFQKR